MLAFPHKNITETMSIRLRCNEMKGHLYFAVAGWTRYLFSADILRDVFIALVNRG
jgi:hypothetical protein